jgi:hypothetical protein
MMADVHIGEMETRVQAVDDNMVLTPAIRTMISQLMSEALENRERDQRRQRADTRFACAPSYVYDDED